MLLLLPRLLLTLLLLMLPLLLPMLPPPLLTIRVYGDFPFKRTLPQRAPPTFSACRTCFQLQQKN
jgi:hypothetical protein